MAFGISDLFLVDLSVTLIRHRGENMGTIQWYEAGFPTTLKAGDQVHFSRLQGVLDFAVIREFNTLTLDAGGSRTRLRVDGYAPVGGQALGIFVQEAVAALARETGARFERIERLRYRVV